MNSKMLSIYDPAMRCSIGVCGSKTDPKLVGFAATCTIDPVLSVCVFVVPWPQAEPIGAEALALLMHAGVGRSASPADAAAFEGVRP